MTHTILDIAAVAIIVNLAFITYLAYRDERIGRRASLVYTIMTMFLGLLAGVTDILEQRRLRRQPVRRKQR